MGSTKSTQATAFPSKPTLKSNIKADCEVGFFYAPNKRISGYVPDFTLDLDKPPNLMQFDHSYRSNAVCPIAPQTVRDSIRVTDFRLVLVGPDGLLTATKKDAK